MIRRSMAVLGAIVLIVSAPLTAMAIGSTLVNESLTHAAVTSSAWVSGGNQNFKACLTAGSNTSQTPVPGCGGTTDADGSGTLRLSDAGFQEAGFALYNQAQPFTAGLTADFDMFMYGGGGIGSADGIGFILVDGSTNLTQPGPPGGSLGYSPQGLTPGVAGGFLGIGFDEFGNYHRGAFGGTDCTQPTFVFSPNNVTIRGPGSGTTGYCILGANTSALPGQLHGGAARSGALRHTHIVIDPSTNASPKVTVSLDFGSGLAQVVQVPLPASPPATFKFGFTASTGAGSDFHEVRNLVSTTQVPLPALTLQKAHTGSFVQGGTGSFQITVGTDPNAGAERQSVRVTDTLPAGLTVGGAPTGSGWDCTITSVGSATAGCVFAGSATTPVPAGNTLPPITLPVAISSSSASSLTNTATASSMDATNSPVSASDTVAVSALAATPVPNLPQSGALPQTSPTPSNGIAVATLVGIALLGGAMGLARRRRARH